MLARLTALIPTILTLLVLADYVRAAEEIKTGDTVIVSTNSAHLNLGDKTLADLEKGFRLQVLAVNGDWVGVSAVVDGKTLQGWVKREAVQVTAEVKVDLPSAPASGSWPQFHGPKRDNIANETGLLKQWPKGGPKLAWTAKGIGFGYSSVAIAHGRIYTAGNLDDKTVLTTLDGNGKILWQVPCGPAWDKEYPGTRGTPTIDGDRLYYETPLGDVVCLDVKTGTRRWGLNILQEFGGENIRWGLSESLLIDGNHLICCPGGKQTAMVALDKHTGKTVWKSASAGELAGHSSPSIGQWQGVRMIFTTTIKAIIGVNADTGELLWKFKHETPYDENILMPVYHQGQVFLSTQVVGSVMLKIVVNGGKVTVEELWRSKELDDQHDGVLLLDGHLYCAGSTGKNRKFKCISWDTGKPVFDEPATGAGSITYADGMLYCLNERGTVSLVRPGDNHAVVSQFKIPEGPEDRSWAHPVVCGGRLYIRHGDRLYAYDVRQ